MSGLSQRTSRATFWSAAGILARYAVQTVVTSVLARLLTPSDFGLLARLLVFVAVSSMLTDVGFGTALIQRPSVTANDETTVFLFSNCVGLLSAVILYSSAPSITHLPIKVEWWVSMETKIKSRKAKVQDEGSLEALSRCAEQKKFLLDNNRMLNSFLAALSQPRPSARLLATYGGYAWNGMRDFTLGESMLSEAVRVALRESAYRITLAKILITRGNFEAFNQQINALRAMHTGGRLNSSLHERPKSKEPHT